MALSLSALSLSQLSWSARIAERLLGPSVACFSLLPTLKGIQILPMRSILSFISFSFFMISSSDGTALLSTGPFFDPSS